MVAVALLKRPSSWEEFILLVRKGLDHPLESERPCVKELRKGTNHMMDVWFEDGLQPLYKKNTIVSLLSNTICPSLCEFLTDENLLDDAYKKACSEKKVEKRTKKVADIMSHISEACDSSKNRKTTDEFRKMSDAMKKMACDEECKNAIHILYASHENARKILTLMFNRLVDALNNHSDVMESTDIPFEAMMIS